MPTILGIHGLANKPPAADEKAGWMAAIKEGLSRNCGHDPGALDFRIIYWADFMYKYPLHTDPAFPLDSHFDDEPYARAPEGALKEYDDSILDSALREFGHLADGIADRIAKDHTLDWVAGPLTERLLKDLDAYYNGKNVRDRAKQMRPAHDVLGEELRRELAALCAAQQPVVLISHSMGTIIAYDVLRDLGEQNPGFRVDHLITLGSPLGLPYVKARVGRDRDGEVRTPTIVRGTWLNFADRRDPVALDTHLRDDYGANASGVRVQDNLVANDYRGAKGKANPHKIYGYLRTPEFSRHLKSLL